MKPSRRFLFLFFLLFMCRVTHAQIAMDTAVTYDPNNPTHLIIAYEEASQSLQTIRNRLRTRYNITSIQNDYHSIQSRLEVYLRIGGWNLQGASLSRLNDIISIFERQLGRIESWQESLVATSEELSDYKIDLHKHTERLSLDLAEANEFQKKYYETRHVPVINEADSLNKLVESKLEEVLNLEYQISQDHAKLFNQVQDLKVFVGQYWDNMMRKEKITWNLASKEKSLLSEAKTQLSNTTWRIIDFFQVNASRVILLIMIMIGAYLLLRHFKTEDEKHHQQPQHPALYQFPVAFSFLLGGTLFPLIFPPTTSLMYDFALLITYVPFLYMLRKSLEGPEFRKYLIFFAFLLALKVQSIFSGTSGFFALLMIFCAVAFIYAIFRQTLRKHLNIRWKWLKLFNWLLTAILVLGIVSILLQRVGLGGIIINGAGETIALAMILMFFASWSDQLMDYLKVHPRSMNMAVDRQRLNEFWLTWSNRVYLFLLVILVVAFLQNFGLYTSVKDSLLDFFNSDRVIGDLTFTYGGVFLFVLVIYLASKLSSTVKFLTEGKSYFKSAKKTANIAVIFRFFLITCGFILALLVSGIPIDRITIILGALSVGIGFGLQSVVNNLISGVILIFEKPIQTGDLVELQQYTGFVKDIGIRASIIRTYDGAEVIVPNGNLVTQEVINWTLSNRERRVEMYVGVAYGSNVEQVSEIILKVLKEHDKVENYPAPAVLLDEFGDSSVNFRCLIWTTDIDHWLQIKSELSTSIYNALNEAKITIPFPQRDLHVVSWTAEAPLPGSNSGGSSASNSAGSLGETPVTGAEAHESGSEDPD